METINMPGRARLAQLNGWLLTTEGKQLAGLLVVAALVRVALVPELQVAPDLQAYETWGELILQHFFHPYTYGIKASSVWLFPTYPPLTMYLYAVIDFFYFGIAHLFGIHASHCACSPLFRIILLTPSILSDLAFVAIIYALARTKLSLDRALLVAGVYALSPAVLLDTVAWGQTDGLALLIAVGALLLALRHKGVWAGVLMGLAIVLKPEPWIFIPLVLLYLYRWAGTHQAIRGAVAMAATAIVLWAPYLLPPNPEFFVWQRSVAINVVASGVTATRNAHNLWWLLGAQRVGINAAFLGPLSPQMVGGALFALVLALALVGIWRDASPGRLWGASALLAIGFFDVGTLGYERYIFPAMGLFLLAWLYDRRYLALFVAVTVSAFVSFGETVFLSGYGLAAGEPIVHQIGALFVPPIVTLTCAALNVGILLAAAWIFLSPPVSPHAAARQAERRETSAAASSSI